MAFSDEQITTMRQKLGLPESADEATILAALDEALDERAEPTAATTTPQIPEGMSLVDSAVLTQLQQGAEAGRTAAATLATQERDREINAALAAGKIAATSRATFEERWASDPTGTKAILDALTPGLVPTAEIGTGAGTEVDEDAAFEAAHKATLAQHGISVKES